MHPLLCSTTHHLSLAVRWQSVARSAHPANRQVDHFLEAFEQSKVLRGYFNGLVIHVWVLGCSKIIHFHLTSHIMKMKVTLHLAESRGINFAVRLTFSYVSSGSTELLSPLHAFVFVRWGAQIVVTTIYLGFSIFIKLSSTWWFLRCSASQKIFFKCL